ncbi:lytic transglycosylase domain-containing protein [Buchananella hordeovulneris]|uniref:lytic transglycosylase domain-containing protein n=1 Tax=Buchananella hordeovulneris TaxID=52770 RepID=UPI0026DC3AD8|nr:lytic murein transglycosylase [Buchananella hordeovulneris]MDO5079881.1 lytic murein transglycosylase [Buchananella hordeovulneris]
MTHSVKSVWLAVGAVCCAAAALAAFALAIILLGRAPAAPSAPAVASPTPGVTQAPAQAAAVAASPTAASPAPKTLRPAVPSPTPSESRGASGDPLPAFSAPVPGLPSPGPGGLPRPSVSPGAAAGPGGGPNATPLPSQSPTGTPGGPLTASITTLPDQAWLERTAQATQIPKRQLAAYAGASLQLGRELPSCQLGWNTLAAIGLIESDHGRLGGGGPDANGVITPSIFGPQLNGAGFAAIADSDQGRLDGDKVWDRAVGPMQFIPTTWATQAADGNADGKTDPHQIDDAALAAARYLCQAGDMTKAEDWIRAVRAYNNSLDYNGKVADQAALYAQLAR